MYRKFSSTNLNAIRKVNKNKNAIFKNYQEFSTWARFAFFHFQMFTAINVPRNTPSGPSYTAIRISVYIVPTNNQTIQQY